MASVAPPAQLAPTDAAATAEIRRPRARPATRRPPARGARAWRWSRGRWRLAVAAVVTAAGGAGAASAARAAWRALARRLPGRRPPLLARDRGRLERSAAAGAGRVRGRRRARGGGRGAAGAVPQPARRPGLLGISSGASLGAVLAIFCGVAAAPSGAARGAFVGAAVTRCWCSRLPRGAGAGGCSPATLLLVGVAVGAPRVVDHVRALVSLAATTSAGRSSTGCWAGSRRAPGTTCCWRRPPCWWAAARSSPTRASSTRSCWARSRRSRWASTCRASPAAGAGRVAGGRRRVAVAGPIGFVGLLVPHILRLAVGRGHRALLPLSSLGGGCSWCSPTSWRARCWRARSRSASSRRRSGAPFFLVLLVRRRREVAGGMTRGRGRGLSFGYPGRDRPREVIVSLRAGELVALCGRTAPGSRRCCACCWGCMRRGRRVRWAAPRRDAVAPGDRAPGGAAAAGSAGRAAAHRSRGGGAGPAAHLGRFEPEGPPTRRRSSAPSRRPTPPRSPSGRSPSSRAASGTACTWPRAGAGRAAAAARRADRGPRPGPSAGSAGALRATVDGGAARGGAARSVAGRAPLRPDVAAGRRALRADAPPAVLTPETLARVFGVARRGAAGRGGPSGGLASSTRGDGGQGAAGAEGQGDGGRSGAAARRRAGAVRAMRPRRGVSWVRGRSHPTTAAQGA